MAGQDGAGTAVIAGLYHDLLGRRSLVAIAWVGVADKRMTLDVPFGCALQDLPVEAGKVLRAFAGDLAATTLAPAG